MSTIIKSIEMLSNTNKRTVTRNNSKSNYHSKKDNNESKINARAFGSRLNDRSKLVIKNFDKINRHQSCDSKVPLSCPRENNYVRHNKEIQYNSFNDTCCNIDCHFLCAIPVNPIAPKAI